MADSSIPTEFEISEPVLICRWRLQSGKLPALNRHMRAFGKRMVNGAPISKQLVGWAKQHIEWTLQDGSRENPNGVLMLMVDAEGRAAMAVGPFANLPETSLSALLARARVSEVEAASTDVAPETLWALCQDVLMVNMGAGDISSGATSLISDLATTLGISVERHANLLDQIDEHPEAFSEVFLVSDEYGVVPASDKSGKTAWRFADGWQTLLEKTGRPGGSAYARARAQKTTSGQA